VKRRDLLRLPLSGAAPSSLRPEPGSEPGSLRETPGAPPPPVRVMAYGPHEMTEFPVDDLEQLRLLRGRWPVLWVNVDGVAHAPTLEAIADIFRLHGLAIEDVTEIGRQSTAEVFDDHLLLGAKMVRLTPELDVEQVSLVIGPDFVISFQERPGDSLEPVRARIRRGSGRIRRAGPDYLGYALLDAMVDHCIPVVEHYMDRLTALEDELLRKPGSAVMARLHQLRRDLLVLRRAVYPLRDSLRWLVREPPEGLVAPETVVYLRDVQDATGMVAEMVESCRELSASLTDLYLSNAAARTNETMKLLTLFAALFIPLGFVLGLFGMNVDDPPAWLRSLPVALGLMVGIAALLLGVFWHRGWLEGPR
jgi:magnesium transporter